MQSDFIAALGLGISCLSAIFAGLAVIVAGVTTYLQFFRVRGPIISIMVEGSQRGVVLPYDRMPTMVRERFPEYQEENPGYLLLQLAFANSGDRTGLVNLQYIGVQNVAALGLAEASQIKASYYDFLMVSAHDIVPASVLLRNIPLADREIILEVKVMAQWSRMGHNFGDRRAVEPIQRTFKVLLVPGRITIPSNAGEEVNHAAS